KTLGERYLLGSFQRFAKSIQHAPLHKLEVFVSKMNPQWSESFSTTIEVSAGWMGGGLSELNDPATHSNGDGLGTIRCPQFLHDVFDVNLHRFFGDEELLGDVTVAVTISNLLKDLDLSASEGFIAVMLGKLGCDLGWDALFTSVNLTDDLYEFSRGHAFKDVGASSSFERSLNFGIAGKRREHDDPGVRKLRTYRHHCVDAAHVGQSKIHQGYVGFVFPECLNAVTAIKSLGGQHHIWLVPDHGLDPLMQQWVVINAEDANFSSL